MIPLQESVNVAAIDGSGWLVLVASLAFVVGWLVYLTR
jgi:hypothetical protein